MECARRAWWVLVGVALGVAATLLMHRDNDSDDPLVDESEWDDDGEMITAESDRGFFAPPSPPE